VERGESSLNVERLVDLADALGVEPAELLPPRPGSLP
jgi:transcriptional regulator with XRE-family HTH domain